MKYVSTSEIASLWGVSERTVRNYCAKGKIKNAFLKGKVWQIPESYTKQNKEKKSEFSSKTLLEVLKLEKEYKIKGGIYHKIQVDLTYNSNHIEGSKLTEEQTLHIFETKTLGIENEAIDVDDIIETVNHFRLIDLIIDKANYNLSESFIKNLHFMLKNGTSFNNLDWFKVGDYKLRPNVVGTTETTKPKDVSKEMKKLIESYNKKTNKTFEDIVKFHYKFEKIHSFQDGNGRVGRLIMFKECLRYNIVPFIIDDELKLFYYRGLKNWENEKGYLLDTCLAAQDKFKKILDYFELNY